MLDSRGSTGLGFRSPREQIGKRCRQNISSHTQRAGGLGSQPFFAGNIWRHIDQIHRDTRRNSLIVRLNDVAAIRYICQLLRLFHRFEAYPVNGQRGTSARVGLHPCNWLQFTRSRDG